MNISALNLDETVVLRKVLERGNNPNTTRLIRNRAHARAGSPIPGASIVVFDVMVVQSSVAVTQTVAVALAVAKNVSVAVGRL